MTAVTTSPQSAREPGAPWTVDEVVRFCRVSRKTVGKLMRGGQLSFAKAGSRVLISDESVRRLAGATK